MKTSHLVVLAAAAGAWWLWRHRAGLKAYCPCSGGDAVAIKDDK